MAPELPTQTAPLSPDPQASAPTHRHARTGRVARLPKTLRDQINQMLLDGVPYAQIIQNLGEPAKELNEDSLKNWKAGGYQDWLAEEDRNQALQAARETAASLLSQQAGTTVQDAARTLAAAQLYELILAFDPAAFAAALSEKPELYLRIINSLTRLSEGDALCAQRQAQQALLQPKASADGSPAVSPKTLTEIARLIKLL